MDKSSSSQSLETTNNCAKRKGDKSKGGRPRMPIWDDYNKGEDDGHRHLGLIEVAKRGKKVNNNRDDEFPLKKKTKTTNQSITYHYQSVNKLTPQQTADITKALLKAFVCCGVPFTIIDNPYFQDFLELLQPSYIPPHKDTLSGSVLDGKIVQVVVKMEAELQKTDNLTLYKYKTLLISICIVINDN
ncbi:12588_t:CDS:2 [Gigaspora margarita]|uniref:12588_t:CDS:1 n=1 Tax=Gigaspora margarita TaxID=4874 RepID=A0ABN7W686_GIGMA|nr:12588_t:CDS:2 [Gigaspora margarita]